ncbi:MAG: hypothetical protein K1X67_01930 [Fimbriimonadaceae bacterium]|nr:hypothetical protein [Fimbriimonadaceae bacterium]
MVGLLVLVMMKPPQASDVGNHVLRLNLQAGQEFTVSLKVDRDNPKTSGEIREAIRVLRNKGRATTLQCSLVGMTLDGKDRSTDLSRMLTNPSVTFSWTDQAQRTGEMTVLEFGTPQADLMPLLEEAGLYLCEFPTRPVGVGDSWRGSTTATGGCTSATYTLKSIEQDVAEIEVTNIRFLIPVEPIGPMRMTVDLKSGLPTRVEYRVKGQQTGRVSRYVQTIG